MNLINRVYEGRGYVYTGLFIGISYPLLRGNFELSAVAAGLIIVMPISLIMAYFHRSYERAWSGTEEWQSNPKNYIRPVLISFGVFGVGIAIFLLTQIL